MDYFSRLEQLLTMERDADKQSFAALTENLNTTRRREEGYAWYPVAIRDTQIGTGDYITVEVERTTHTDLPHQFRSGVTAALFSNHDPQTDRVEGRVAYVRGNHMGIALRVDELPEWTRNGKLGADLLFDDFSYDEMFSALRAAGKKDQEKSFLRLRDILTGKVKPSFVSEEVYGSGGTGMEVNNVQAEAIQKIITAEELAIVHGPPGTGKTTTLAEAVRILCTEGQERVLVTAASNAAVDLLTERLSGLGLRVLRIGNPVRVSGQLQSLTMDAGMQAHPQAKELKLLRRRAGEFRDMAHKYKRNFGREEREQRKALLDEARKLYREAGRTEQYIQDDLIARAQVITATLVGAAHPSVRHLRYRTVVIDEAGQASEPACWIPILRAERVILAGDPHQLPPTVKSHEAGISGLSETLLEKLMVLHPEAVVMLEEQYRMHRSIMEYPSSVFYRKRLLAHVSVADRLIMQGDEPLLVIDTAGCGFEEQREGSSTGNPEEAAFLLKHFSGLLPRYEAQLQPGEFPSVGIIAPYRRQVALLKELVNAAGFPDHCRNRISVETIDSYQGQERDVIYISLTRSNPEERLGFLSDIRRINVAMTRARKKLVLIGDSATFGRFDFYAGLLRYAEETGAYRSAWEFMGE